MPNIVIDTTDIDISVNITETDRNVISNIQNQEKVFFCNFTRAQITIETDINNTSRVFRVKSGTQPIIYDDMDELSKYQLENFDLDNDPIYSGYMDKGANWYIAQTDISSGSKLYAQGATDYETNWINRASLTYGTYAETF